VGWIRACDAFVKVVSGSLPELPPAPDDPAAKPLFVGLVSAQAHANLVTEAWNRVGLLIDRGRKGLVAKLEKMISGVASGKPLDEVELVVLSYKMQFLAALLVLEGQADSLQARVDEYETWRASPHRRTLSLDQLTTVMNNLTFGWIVVKQSVAELDVLRGNAYRAFPHEADAFAAGGKVTSELLAKAAREP